MTAHVDEMSAKVTEQLDALGTLVDTKLDGRIKEFNTARIAELD
jgi:hypothetical protein